MAEQAIKVRQLRVAINCEAERAYEFLSAPENFPKWASGLAASLRKSGDEWIAQTPQGLATVRFSERNSRGVLDHAVTLPQGRTVYVPLRVVAKEGGCELVLTLFRRPGMSEERFAADAQWVMHDLNVAKRILEG
jgi:hypothetical protein